MYNPSDSEIARAVADARAMQLLDDDAQTSLRQQLKNSHPDWALSAKASIFSSNWQAGASGHSIFFFFRGYFV